MLILINILLFCHDQFQIRIEKGPMTEPVVFCIGHLRLHSLWNHFCVLSFHSVIYFPHKYHMLKEETGE